MNPRRHFLLTLPACLWLPGLTLAQPDPPPIPGLRRWGSGPYRYFGFHLYDATLWAGEDPAKPPLALRLTYRRAIASRQIVQASVSEMARLGAGEEVLGRWERQLAAVIPDVAEGDHLLGLHTGQRAVFSHNGQPRGAVEDEAFARYFFGIWLDPRTRAPALRAALLRQGEGGA